METQNPLYCQYPTHPPGGLWKALSFVNTILPSSKKNCWQIYLLLATTSKLYLLKIS
jgi:hypothetical protein